MAQQPQYQAYQTAPQKSFVATWLLSLLVGTFGVDRFYMGKIGTGILKLITGGGFGIWYIVDLVLTLVGSQTDKVGRPLVGYEENKRVAWIVTIIWVFGGILIGVLSGVVSAIFGIFGN